MLLSVSANMKQLLAPFIFLSLANLTSAADNPSLAGKWKIHTSIAGDESDQSCTFTQSNKDLAGTCINKQGTVTIAGKITENKVTWQHKSEYEGQSLTIVYTGTVDSPTKIVGTVDVEPMDVSGDFTAILSQ